MQMLSHVAPSVWVSVSDESRHHEWARRTLNILVAGIGLVLALPLMLLVAMAVKLTSRGPVIYMQPRVGLDRRAHVAWPPEGPRRHTDAGGRIFRIYKFRTMTCQACGTQVWAREADPRITPVGRVLRKYRLDELPQLVNVLLGDMNVVGPRPEQPEIFRRLQVEVQGYPLRQRVLPGITGLAQIRNGYDHSLDDVRRKVEYDLSYVASRSLWHDLDIMARTPAVMLFKVGSL